MDDDDFDALFEDLAGDSPPSGSTVSRATIRDGRITLTNWQPWMAEVGPLAQLLRARERAEVAIADLRTESDSAGKKELIVEFMAAGRAREAAESALAGWAENVGFDRIWFPGGPVDLDPAARGLATASVTCPTCGADWVDATPAFWTTVKELGHFPDGCPVCGNSLPQWEVVDGDATRCRSTEEDPLGDKRSAEART